ncbi:MAG: uroporphyrinogen decarboxylase family protein [Spirochaetota bacterium]
MDSKTRIMKSLNFQTPDRIGRFDVFWPEFKECCQQELGLQQNTSLEEYFEIDIHIAVPDETPFPSRAAVLSDDGVYITERTGFGSVIRKKKNGYFFHFLEPVIRSRDEWSSLLFESAALDSRYDSWEREVREVKGKGLCVFGKIGGPYIRTGFVRGESEWLMDIAGDPDFARETAVRYAEHLLAIGLEELKRGDLYDTGIWIFDDMGHNTGPIMSPESFEYIFYPAYKALVQGLKKAGASKVGLHSDGDIRLLLDMLIDAGIDLINPVEPKAGMSIPQLRHMYGTKLAYVGGMCNTHILPSGSEEEIRRSVLEILEIARDGGVVIGAHSIGPDISLQAYKYYYETVLRFGQWE